jgi:hypothetical protein
LFTRGVILEIAIVERGIDDRMALVDSAVVNRDFERDAGHLRNAPNIMAELLRMRRKARRQLDRVSKERSIKIIQGLEEV